MTPARRRHVLAARRHDPALDDAYLAEYDRLLFRLHPAVAAVLADHNVIARQGRHSLRPAA